MDDDRGTRMLASSRELRARATLAVDASRHLLRYGRALLAESAERCERPRTEARPGPSS